MAERNNTRGQATPTSTSPNRRSQAEKIALVRNRITDARQIRIDWQRRFRLEQLYEKFYGEVATLMDNFDDDELMSINRFWPDIKTLIPSLFLQNPIFIVRSKNESTNPESILRAKMGEAGLRAIADQEQHFEFSVKLGLLQSFFSIGILKSVYDPTMKKNPRAGEPIFENINGTPILDPETHELTPIIDPNGRPALESERIVDDETYRWDWINGDKMLLPSAGPAHLRWPWLAEEVTVLLEDAREDERFPTNLRSQLKPNTSGDETLGGMRSSFGQFPSDDDNGDEFITYVEYWDINNQRQIVWVDGQTFSETRFLIERDLQPGVEKHPYSILKYTPIVAPKPSPWPVPHVWNWLPVQNAYSNRRRQVDTAARRSARKIYYDEGTFPDADSAVLALQSSEDLQAVMVNSVENIPRGTTDPPLPPEILQDLQIIDNDWMRTTGISGARAGANRGADSATEARISASAGQTRDLDMRHDVNIWLETAGRKMLQLLQGTLTLGMFIKMRGTNDSLYLNYVARVYGPEFAQNISQFPGVRRAFDEQFGDDRWQVLTREDLEFQADVSIAPGSARPRNMETEKQDFVQIIELLGSVPILTQSRALLSRVADMFEFFDDSMIDEILAASQRSQQIEAIQAGRFQGGDNTGANQPQPAAQGGGANVSEFRRNFVG